MDPLQKRNYGFGDEDPAAGQKGAGPKGGGKPGSPSGDPFEPLEDQLLAVRSLLIKSAVAAALWLIILFFTVEWWFSCVSKGFELVVMGPFEVIRFYVRTSAAIALGLSVPFILYFLWQYVQKVMGLRSVNVSMLRGMVPLMIGLFFIGLVFGYFVVHPVSYYFLIQ